MFKHLKHGIFGLAFCGITFPVCATYDSVDANTQGHHLNNFKREIAQLARDFSNTQPFQESINEYSTEEYYDFFKMIHIIQEALEFSEEMSADSEAMLSPENLCEYENIIEIKEFLSIFVSALDLYEKKYKEELTLIESRIKEAFLEKENTQRPALKELEESKATLIQLMSEYFFIARECAQRVNDILDFSSSNSGNFWELHGILIFKKDEDAAIYNALIKKLIEIDKKEDILLEKLEMHKQWILKKMEHIVL